MPDKTVTAEADVEAVAVTEAVEAAEAADAGGPPILSVPLKK